MLTYLCKTPSFFDIQYIDLYGIRHVTDECVIIKVSVGCRELENVNLYTFCDCNKLTNESVLALAEILYLSGIGNITDAFVNQAGRWMRASERE